MGYSVSTYVVRGMMIDAAFNDVGAELMSWLAARPVRGVIITHAHDDHGGNAERLAQAGVPLVMHHDTEALLRTPRPQGLYRRWTWGPMPVLASSSRTFIPDGLELVFTPGHSPDHCAVWDAARETVFAGDLFLGVKVKIAHPTGREDVRQQIASVRKAIALRPRRVFDAHRGLIADGIQALEAKAAWLEDTCGRIDDLVDAGMSDGAIVRQLFGGEDRLRWISAGDFSRRNFVANVRRTHHVSRD